MGSVDHLRYIFTHLDGELAADIEENSPGGLKMLCNLYSLQLQLEKLGLSDTKNEDDYISRI